MLPKMVIASNGKGTFVFMDGICIGQGVGRVDFSTHNAAGEMKSTLHICDADVGHMEFVSGEEAFLEIMDALARE